MLTNNVSNRWLGIALLAAALFCFTGAASAQEESAVSTEERSETSPQEEPRMGAQENSAVSAQEKSVASPEIQANNPLTRFTAFNIQNYYIGERTETDKKANQLWLRFLQPFSIGETNWVLRALLTVSTLQTAIGDLNLAAPYVIDTGNPAVSFGVGPQLTAPLATENALGSEKWSAGLVNTLFDMRSPKFQYGYLLSWQGSFAGKESSPDVNLGTFQPLLYYQLGGGTYLRSTAICSYNFENSTYSVPVGLGIGHVFPWQKATLNLFVEPQVSMADTGAGWPKWQIYLGFNTQFK